MTNLGVKTGWIGTLISLSLLGIFAQLAFLTTFCLASGSLSLLPWTELSQVKAGLPYLLAFISTEMIINVIFVGLLGYVILSAIELFQWQARTATRFTILLWVAATSAVLIANSYYFPNSLFAFELPLSKVLIKGILAVLLVILFGVFVLAGINLCLALIHKRNTGRHTTVLFLLAVVAAVYGHYYWVEMPGPQFPTSRENLATLSEITLDETLPKRLQSHGYETLYASDDTTWSEINQHFGFDRWIGPPSGGIALFLGLINDFPLSNLLITTPFGSFLFPSNYANHLMAFTYDPENFLHLLKVALHHRTGKPLFLAVHFNLNGWPHYWAREKNGKDTTEFDAYKNTLGVADQQLGDFFAVLAENKLLNHTLVVLLSDHGTGLGLPGDRITAEDLYQGDTNNIKLPRLAYAVPVTDKMNHRLLRGIDTYEGYGGDILSQVTYHTLLTFKGYGFALGPSKTITQPTSLLDIAPTVLALLNMSPLATADGISLKPYLFDPAKQIDKERALFMETAFSLTEQRWMFPLLSRHL